MKRKLENLGVIPVLLILAGILLLVPIFTLPAVCNFFNFSNSGQIGDTIGGITAPFINGLAAILVFLAFKEQIKANEIFKNQEKARMILDQIALLQEDKMEIEKQIRGVINRKEKYQEAFVAHEAMLLNKLIYFFTEINLTNELINEYKGEKDFLYRKLCYLYSIRYKTLLDELNSSLNTPFFWHTDYNKYINEIMITIQKLNSDFANANKYKKS